MITSNLAKTTLHKKTGLIRRKKEMIGVSEKETIEFDLNNEACDPEQIL